MELAALVKAGQVSPAELVELFLHRISAINPSINAYVTVAGEQARDTAAVATKRLSGARRDELPPFHGVPISIKDLSETAGIRTTHGLSAWSGRIPAKDDEAVARLQRAGFIILGKTITPELGPINVSEPPGYPPGRNPWDPMRSCGGSSGGAAAALAAGLCPVSHGSDGGGSIRTPSSWCGVFGLKPSRGRISDAPETQQWFSVQGPITRSVADAAALLDVMAGPSAGDIFWAPPPSREFRDEVGRDPGRLRVGFTIVPPTPGIEVAPANVRAVREAAALLASLGHAVDEVAPPTMSEQAVPDLATLMFTALAAREASLPPIETMSLWSQGLIAMGRDVKAVDYVAAEARIAASVRRVVAEFGSAYDILLTPTVAAPPPLVGEFGDLEISNVPRLWALAPFTGLWNSTGQPAVSIPWSFDELGLPVGVQFVGPPAREDLLLRLSGQIEAAHPWSDWRPPLALVAATE